MSANLEIDLDTEKANVDGEWLSRDELWERMNQSIGAKDYKNISRLASLLEQVDVALSGAQTITFKLGGEHFARLQAAGQKMGQSPAVFAREVLVQILSGAAPKPVEAPVPLAAPPPVVAPPAVAAPVSVEPLPEQPPALTLQPKRRDASPLASAAPPPVMTPVTAPPVASPDATVVVDVSSGEESKPAGEGRRWFDRT